MLQMNMVNTPTSSLQNYYGKSAIVGELRQNQEGSKV